MHTGSAMCCVDVVVVFFLNTRSMVLSLLPSLKSEHLLSLFIPPSGRGARRWEGDTVEAEHKGKQAAAIRLQQGA